MCTSWRDPVSIVELETRLWILSWLNCFFFSPDDIINVAAHRLSTGTLEQALTSHPQVTEACVVGLPDPLKGHLPFAFVQTTTSGIDDATLLAELQQCVRTQVGAIATLGGVIVSRQQQQGKSIIPKTRSGKTLRRVLRELLENGARGEWEREVAVPSTVEDRGVVEAARAAVRGYFEGQQGRGPAAAAGGKAKL